MVNIFILQKCSIDSEEPGARREVRKVFKRESKNESPEIPVEPSTRFGIEKKKSEIFVVENSREPR